jgi:hypothetical protein
MRAGKLPQRELEEEVAATPDAGARSMAAAESVEARACAARGERASRFAAERDRLDRRSGALTRARIVTFVGGVAALLWAEVGGAAAQLAGVPLGSALLLGFLVLLLYHRRVRARQRWFAELVRVNQEAIARIRRDWNSLPSRGAVVAEPDAHPYARDLDVTGHASLFQLLGSIGTAPGREMLRRWLLEPAPPAEITDRQAAVRELSQLADFRDELTARGRIEGEASAQDVARFLAWAEAAPWLLRRSWLLWTVRLLPIATLALLIAFGAGLIPGAVPVAVLPVQFTIAAVFGRHALAAFSAAFSRQGVYQHDAQLFGQLGGTRFHSPLLHRLQQQLTVEGLSAARQMRRLAQLMHASEIRYSPMAHFSLQLLLLWDLQILDRLERWQRTNGPHARTWLDILGRIDALCALGGLAQDHPEWTFPELRDSPAAGPDTDARILARGLAHPLLRPAVARPNNVELGPPGTFMLVTGSNMSGKSTLLRAIGTNLVLAQAGAPVAAAYLRFSPVRIYTSMRVQDSLEEGVSFFMAELRRLKQIVDAARALRTSSEQTLLYLLDEILQGTNTAERQVAARRIIRHLLQQRAIGAVTTHDLALAETEGLADGAQLVHFQERIERSDGRMKMSFDYDLRPGVATSTNALALMELVGLGLES